MRLTLRTLLAYRDGVLNPADAEDLHRRIQLSQDAGNLLKRIGAITKMNNLLAPPVLGKGLGGDPNSIAEYLDDALQHSQVPELERVCLVSDVQLAELADCHALLSTAMNTKVNVPPELRRIAVAVGDPKQRSKIQQELEERKPLRRSGSRSTQVFRIDEAHSAGEAEQLSRATAVAVQVQAPMVASGGESIKPQGLDLETSKLSHEVPEYLFDSSTGGWRIPLAIGGLVALLAVLVWQTLGPWDRVAELFATAPVNLSRGANSSEANVTGALPKNSNSLDTIVESEQAPPGVVPEAASETSTISDTGEGTTDAPIVVDSSPPPGAVLDNSGQPIIVAPNPTESGSTSPLGNVPSSSAVWLPRDELEQRAVILVRADRKLSRMRAGEPLPLPSGVIIPPSTRPTLDLASGVLWTACGPSVLELASDAGTLSPSLSTTLCRALIRGGPEGRQVRISTPMADYLVELTDAGSLATVEFAYRPASHGSVLDQRAFKPVLVVVAAAEGSVSIQVEGSADGPDAVAAQLELGDGVAFIGTDKMTKFRLTSIPAWYGTSVERPIDGLAVEDMHQLLSPLENDEGLGPTITALSSHRKPETAALAVQLAILSGDWRSFAGEFLNDERLRSHWTPTISLARQLLAGDPARAERLRTILVQTQGEEGRALFEMLCGFSEDQLAADGLIKLVQQLESNRLDHRVLAAYQLQALTGKNFGYLPFAPSRASIQQWRRELAANRLSVSPLSDLIWERIPPTAGAK